MALKSGILFNMKPLPPILFQDDYLVALNKPCGMLSVPGRGPEKIDSLAHRVQNHFPDAKVVHRLDCYTSGVMLFAIGIDVQRELNRQFRDREIDKEYVAMVHGVIKEESGVMDQPMRLDVDNRPVQIVDYEQGKPCETHWRVIERSDNSTRLKLVPITGRSHQLRVHCRELGYPIVGDHFYGLVEDKDASVMLLHAERLEFTHPMSRERVVVVAPCGF